VDSLVVGLELVSGLVCDGNESARKTLMSLPL